MVDWGCRKDLPNFILMNSQITQSLVEKNYFQKDFLASVDLRIDLQIFILAYCLGYHHYSLQAIIQIILLKMSMVATQRDFLFQELLAFKQIGFGLLRMASHQKVSSL